MKKVFAGGLLFVALVAASIAFAAGETPVQPVASRLDAAGLVGTSATSSATITLTCPNGTVPYVSAVDIANCAGSSAVTAAAVTTITSTNLGGVAWTMGSGVAAGLCQPSPAIGWSVPLKAAASTATIVLPAFATNQTIRVNAYYYCAP